MLKKRNLKRAVSLLTAFLFIFECFPLWTFAASAPALTYSIDAEGAQKMNGNNIFYANRRGDIVTVRFTMIRTDSTEIYSLNTMQNEIEFDMSFFDFVEDSISVEKSGVNSEHQIRVRGQEIVKAASMMGSGFATEQLMCTFDLKIKENAEADHGWVRCSEAKAVSTDYISTVITEENLDVYLKQDGLTVTATGYSGVYDGVQHTVTATVNIPDGTTVAYSTDNGVNWSENAPSRKNAGTTQVKIRARNDAYFDAETEAVLEITPQPLTVQANPVSKIYGENDPDLSVTADGFLPGDSLSGRAEREPGENAGTYAIRQGTLSAGNNYTISFQSADFTILAKDISQAVISLSAHTLNYTGTAQSVSVNAVTLNGTALTEADYSVNTDSATQGTNVGPYTITVTGKGNYSGSASVKWNIVNAGINAQAENVSVTYDKQPYGITVTDVPSGAVITYSTDGETYSETNPVFTDAGARVVHYKVTAPGYDEFTGSATVTVAKRPVTVSGIAALNKVYDGTTSAELDFSGVVFENIIGGDNLTVTASGLFDSPDAGENKTVEVTGLSLGGESVNNYVLVENGQQSAAFADITPAGMTVNITGYEGVYDHQAHSPAVEMPEGAEILWSDTEDGTYTEQTPSFINAGTYTVYYRVQRSNYTTVSGSVSVIITPKSITGATVLLEQNGFVYDGEIHIAVVQTVTLPDGDILSGNDYTVSNDRTANAGYYLLTVTGQGNYKDTATASWTIRNNPSGGISAADIHTIYDGNPHSISVVGTPDGAVITYSTDGETYSEINPSFTDAGETITVHYKVTAPNYDGFTGSATVTITKRPVTVSGMTAENKIYDGNIDATLNYSGVIFDGIVDGDELTVSATGTFADAEVGNGKTVNITGLTLGGADAGNYQLAAEGQQTETTANITANTMGVTAQGWSGVYDGESHSITVNAPADATVTYSETENGIYHSENPAYKNAGNYTVFYRVEKTNSDTVNGSETVEIRKAEIVPVLRMTDRFHPETERNIWSYSSLAGVPALTVTQADRVVTDYGMTMYRYKEQTATDYLPYSAEELEVLPVGQYTLRVEIAESKNYLAASAETDFSIIKAPHENVEAGPFTVLADTENLSVNLISSLVDEASCTVSGFSGSLIGGGVTVTGSTLQFNTGNGESGSIQVTVSSPNYEDYSVTVLLTAGSSFRLSFDSNGGSAVTETRNLVSGAVFGTLPVSTRIGYTFDGWYTTPGDGERVSAATRMGGADTTLYAHWTAEEYTVTLILNGGELNSTDGWTVSGDTAARTFQIDTPDFLLPGAVRDKYSFTGWVQNADRAVLEVTVYQGTMRNLVFEAAWLEGKINGEVEFIRTDENSGILGIKDMDQSDGDTQKSTTSDDEYRPVSLTNAMKEIASDFAGQTAGTDTRQDVTVTLKTQAVESLTEREEHTLTQEERETRREQEAIHTRAEAFYTAEEKIRQDFLAINMEQVVTTYTVGDNGEETGTESDPEPVLEAPRVVEIPLRYDLTGRYNPIVFRFHNDAAFAFTRLTFRPREYQSRDGYFYVSGRGNAAVIYLYTSRFSTYSVATSNMEAWTVFFETDGGTEIPHQSIPTAGDRKVVQPPDPVKSGYTFDGWYVPDNGEQKPFNFDTDTISGDTTIYAKWTEAPVTPVPSSRSRSSSITYYTVTTVNVPGGTAETSVTRASRDTVVRVTVRTDEGYTVSGVTVRTVEGLNVSVTRNTDGTFIFTQPAGNVTVTPSFKPAAVEETPEPVPGTDSGYTTENPAPPDETGVADWLITETHPAYIQGFGDGTFRPNNNVTRAQTAMMFYRLLKNQNVSISASFIDMNGDEWYAEAVYTLSGLGIIQGYSDGSFHGNDPISRAAFTAIAVRFAKSNATVLYDSLGTAFSDVPENHWARDTITKASFYGWIRGYSDGSFHPSESITRAAVVAIINRMLGRSADQAYLTAHRSELKQFTDVQDSGAWYYYHVAEAANAHSFTLPNGKEVWQR